MINPAQTASEQSGELALIVREESDLCAAAATVQEKLDSIIGVGNLCTISCSTNAD